MPAIRITRQLSYPAVGLSEAALKAREHPTNETARTRGAGKATLASLLARVAPGLRFNEHLDEKDGPLVFAQACKLGLEGIVSKRRDSPYRSGRPRGLFHSK